MAIQTYYLLVYTVLVYVPYLGMHIAYERNPEWSVHIHCLLASSLNGTSETTTNKIDDDVEKDVDDIC